jgi:hypothetical protein
VGEGGFRVQPIGIASGGDQELPGNFNADARQAEK